MLSRSPAGGAALTGPRPSYRWPRDPGLPDRTVFAVPLQHAALGPGHRRRDPLHFRGARESRFAGAVADPHCLEYLPSRILI